MTQASERVGSNNRQVMRPKCQAGGVDRCLGTGAGECVVIDEGMSADQAACDGESGDPERPHGLYP